MQHFLASDIRDHVIAEDALATARSGQVGVAARIAAGLPDEGKWKFLRASLIALAYWDDFDYAQAKQTLEHQALKASEYARDPLLASLADTVTRLAADARQMSEISRDIRNEQNFGATATTAGWPERIARDGALLVADTLANAQRRIVEGRFTDSVLRSYRAAECATQIRLLAIGIHPSRPDACQASYERYFAASRGNDGLAFRAGLQFLESVGQLDLAPIDEHVKRLGRTRNYTYLEHGYERVQYRQTEPCFELSLLICQHLLGREISETWHRFEMRF